MGLAPKRRQRVVQLAFGQPAERGDEAVLAARGSELRKAPWLLEREIERQISGERGHGYVVVRERDHVDEVTGKETGRETHSKIPPRSMPHGRSGALPAPARQHGLEGQTHEEVDSEKGPGVRREQGGRQEVEMITVCGEDQGVQEKKADTRAGHDNAQRQDQSRARCQRNRGDEHQECDVGERRQVADVGDDGVQPCDRGTEREVVPEKGHTDDGHQRGIDDGEPASPAEQPSSWAQGHCDRISYKLSRGPEHVDRTPLRLGGLSSSPG